MDSMVIDRRTFTPSHPMLSNDISFSFPNPILEFVSDRTFPVRVISILILSMFHDIEDEAWPSDSHRFGANVEVYPIRFASNFEWHRRSIPDCELSVATAEVRLSF